MSIIRALFICMATASITLADVPPKGTDPQTIEDKAGIRFDQKLYLQFNAKGSRLLEPKSYKGTDNDKSMIKLELMTGGPIPGRVLVVHNHFDRSVQFRVLVRLQDTPDFIELNKGQRLAEPGKSWCHFWPDRTPIEEAILYEFRLSDIPAKDE